MKYPNDIIKHEIESASNPAEFHKALLSYYTVCGANAEGYIQHQKPKIECHAGCSFCCFLRVGVRAHEVYLIANYIQKHFTSTDKAEIINRLQVHWDTVFGLTRHEHLTTNIPCPMMLNYQCSVYPARPMSCRRYHSMDISSCKYSYDNPKDESEVRDQDIDLEILWMGMTDMLHQVYEKAGYDSRSYELGMALLEALQNPKSEKRWRGKKKAFLKHPDTK